MEPWRRLVACSPLLKMKAGSVGDHVSREGMCAYLGANFWGLFDLLFGVRPHARSRAYMSENSRPRYYQPPGGRLATAEGMGVGVIRFTWSG